MRPAPGRDRCFVSEEPVPRILDFVVTPVAADREALSMGAI
ncbi:hypothetical protein [Mycobacterium helveticum]|nr:hypothetical protein [Mycobacterium helveticum]